MADSPDVANLTIYSKTLKGQSAISGLRIKLFISSVRVVRKVIHDTGRQLVPLTSSMIQEGNLFLVLFPRREATIVGFCLINPCCPSVDTFLDI